MEYLPITVKLAGKKCILVGGGEVAFRKLKTLLLAGADVRLISLSFTEEILQLAAENRLKVIQSELELEHIDGAYLVVSATGSYEANQYISQLCQENKVWVNIVDDIQLSSFLMPAIVDRSPLLVAISTGGFSPVLARKIREKLEWLLPSNLNQLLIKLQVLRPLLKKNFNKVKLRRHFYEWYLERAFNEDIPMNETVDQSLELYHSSAEKSQGKVYLVGAGPGDPELLTVKALKLLQKADVVLFDSLVSREIRSQIRKDAKLVDVGKRALLKSAKQVDIHQQMAFYAKQGLSVVRLKGGDPFIFGRGGEELEYLHDMDIAFEVVPGITAAAGCASYAGIPLTHRDHAQSLMFVTAQCKNSKDTLDWKSLARDKQTLVVYMGILTHQVLLTNLLKHGREPDTPVAIIENGTTVNQRVVTGVLQELPQLVNMHQLKSPSVIIIGTVAKLAAKLHWYEMSTLFSNRKLVSSNSLTHNQQNDLKIAV